MKEKEEEKEEEEGRKGRRTRVSEDFDRLLSLDGGVCFKIALEAEMKANRDIEMYSLPANKTLA